MTLPRHVLVIDDSVDDRDLCERTLTRELAVPTVDLTTNGEQGLAAYRERTPECVLLDVHMPGLGGLEVLKRLKAIDAHATVVVMTGEGNEDIAVGAMKAGALDYIAKDMLTAPTLRRALSNAADKGALLRRIAEQRDEQANFIRILVHDIRAPLRGLTSFTDILGEDLEAGAYDALPEHLELIRLSAMRMNALVDTLAHYALMDREIAFETVDMSDIVNQVLDHLHMMIDERQAEVTIGPLPDVTGHGPQLVQLLQNLISNGIKYNRQPVPTVSVTAENRGDDWLFTVEDNGIGIPKDKQKAVFEPFERLWGQDVFEGTGLGLAICRKVVERHGGRIWCQSAIEQGSRFSFTLMPG